MSTLGIAMIGLGYPEHTLSWARAIDESSRMKLIGVSSSDPEVDGLDVLKRTEFSGEYGANTSASDLRLLADRYWREDPEAVISDAEVQIVIVNNVPAQHRATAVRAFEAGKHVILEKPIATTLEDADAIIAAARDAKKHLMIPFSLRFVPGYALVKSHIERGTIGGLISAHASIAGRWSDTEMGSNTGEVNAWRAHHLDLGGGLIYEEVVHLVDLLLWLSGSAVSEVFAYKDNVGHTIDSPLGRHPPEVEDRFAAIVRFESGMTATLDANYVEGATWQTRFTGTKGEIQVMHRKSEGFIDNPETFIFTRDGTHLYSRSQGMPRMQALLEHFVDSVYSNTPVSPNGEDGRRASEVIAGMFNSAEHGMPIRIR